MILSLNEVESLASKAARGAGRPWGIAEEAGKATRWLCAAGLPGGEALAVLLGRTDGIAHTTLSPVGTDTARWRTARGGPLCPLFTGAAICDLAGGIGAGRALVLGPIFLPLMLLPYVVMAADAAQTALSISWQGARLSRSPGGSVLDAATAALGLPEVSEVRIACGTIHGVPLHRGWRAGITAGAFDILGAFAHRTYAPDNAASRLAGAGAGLSDND